MEELRNVSFIDKGETIQAKMISPVERRNLRKPRKKVKFLILGAVHVLVMLNAAAGRRGMGEHNIDTGLTLRYGGGSRMDI